MGVGVCCPFDFLNLRKHFEKPFFGKILNRLLALNYKKYIRRSMISPIEMGKCKLLEDIDNLLLEAAFGYNNLDKFYSDSSCIGLLEKIS